MRILLTVALFVTLFVFFACEDYRDINDFDRSDYRPEFAVPLATGEFEFSEIIGQTSSESYLEVNEDGQVVFVFSGDVARQGSLDIFNEIQLIPFVAQDSCNVIPIPLTNEILLDYAVLSGGSMSILSRNPYAEPIMVELYLPELRVDGEEYLREFGPFAPDESITIDQPLEGIELILGKEEMTICVTAILPDGTRDRLPSDNTFGALRNMTFSYIEGYWDYEVIPMDEDTIEIEVFETLRRGDMFFEEPVVTVNLENSFGFPVRADIRALEMYTITGDTFEIESPFVENGFDIEYPQNNGEFENTIFQFTKDNSNLPTATSIKPLALYYDMYAIANPDRDTSITGFMSDSSEIIVRVDVRLPLKGRASEFEARDTVDFQVPETDGSYDIEDGELKLYFENSIPVGLTVQGYLWDENNQVIDSLFGQDGITVVGHDAATGAFTTTDAIVPFTQEQFDLWESAEKVHIVARFTSVNYPDIVTIRGDDKMRFGMGIKAELSNL
ncbi:MAG TPA: hypothetical protein VJ917_08405 [Saprospiraceae bacterium]|nr:hypothetical protein [Saprospiraceae bacterium]